MSTQNSDSTTNGIRVKVIPEFLGIREHNGNPENIFSYHVIIYNNSDKTYQLKRRYWLIIDANGNQEVVEGEGVIGYTPIIESGMSFSYTSMCPLHTDWGTMEGHYTMVSENNEECEVHIGRFYLVHPKLLEDISHQ